MTHYKRYYHLCLSAILASIFFMGCVSVKYNEEHIQTHPAQEKQPPTSKSVLAPVYAPLAEWLVNRFHLESLQGIGIDLGSGKGDLIVELAQRTPSLHWINADINPGAFYAFFQKAQQNGIADRISAQYADAKNLPYKDGYADIVVSRGSFPFWGGVKAGLSEVNRILKVGGIAYIGRGFSENLPAETARAIRERQKKNARFPAYDVDQTEQDLRQIMQELNIQNYQIHRPHPSGSEGVNYGIWLEWRKQP
ncbi:MAG: class I SAM-dependent methyltransferase [Candidatus Omnitrophica bacterium]|nr:class I SAM-dependent methyltransferase [Candidatus Omnitrophota bacterium]